MLQESLTQPFCSCNGVAHIMQDHFVRNSARHYVVFVAGFRQDFA